MTFFVPLTALTLAVVPSSSSRVEYSGNGSTKAFIFTFSAQAVSHVEVFVAGMKQTSGVGVTLNPNQASTPGGTVTFTTAPPPAAAVRIQRTVPLTQETVYTPYSAFPAKTTEKALDRVMMAVQQVYRDQADAVNAATTAQAQVAAAAGSSAAAAQAAIDAANAVSAAAVPGSTSLVTATGASNPRALKDRFADEGYNVKSDFGCVGDGVADDTTCLQAALSSGMKKIRAPAGTYRTTAQLLIDGKDGVKLIGDGSNQTIIRYTGAQDSTLAMLKIRRSSYVRVEDIGFTSQYLATTTVSASLAGMGVYVTSDGTGVTQYNTIRNVSVKYVSVAGIQIGNTGSAGTDTNVDGNRVEESFIWRAGTGVRVYQTNTNLTGIFGGSVAECTYSGIEVGQNARGVRIERVLMFLNGGTGGTNTGQEILVRRENSGPISIRDMVTEMYLTSWLRVEPSSGGTTNRSLITIEGVNVTNNLPAMRPVIDYQGNGAVTIRNARFGGGLSVNGVAAPLTFRPPNADNGGTPNLITENVELYDGAYWDVETSAASGFMGWQETFTISRSGNAGEGTAPERVKRTRRTRAESYRLAVFNPSAGVTVANMGHQGQSVWKATIDKAAFIANAKTQSIVFATLPAKTRVLACYSDTTQAFAGTGLTDTIALQVGGFGAGDDALLLSHDVKSAPITAGLVASDLGTKLATPVQGGGFVSSWTSSSVQPYVTLTAGAGGGNLGNGTITNLTAGSVTLYLVTETMP